MENKPDTYCTIAYLFGSEEQNGDTFYSGRIGFLPDRVLSMFNLTDFDSIPTPKCMLVNNHSHRDGHSEGFRMECYCNKSGCNHPLMRKDLLKKTTRIDLLPEMYSEDD
uniref:Uncharacterized protein n=1 Tax=Caenorhabditis japonica TaxID=281687 RepID=A0A8R1EM68_CAEJA